MRLKKANTCVRACVLAIFVVLSAVLLAPTTALALPEGRTYEMVSPPYKGGYDAAGIVGVAPDGESVAFGSLGAFAGDPANNVVDNSYLVRRTDAGWVPAPLTAPAALTPDSGVLDLSPTLDSSLSEAKFGLAYSAVSEEGGFLLHRLDLPDTAANFELAAGTVFKESSFNYRAASPDFSRIVFEDSNDHKPLLPQAGTPGALYELATTGASEPLRLLALNNKQKPIGSACVGLRPTVVMVGGKGSKFNEVSADGSEIFFTTGVAGSNPEECYEHSQLFVRLDGSHTLEVSKPLAAACVEVPCAAAGSATRAPALFQGASEDGSKVFFTAPRAAGQPPLVPGDTDASNNLYMATIGCGAGEEGCEAAGRQVTSLTQVSHDPTGGEPAEVQGVVALAPDGSRVYFVARGVLSGANVEGGAPVKGADNLYVYDSASGQTAFITDLCSGAEASGEAQDARCPSNLDSVTRNDTALWGPEPEAQTTADGGFLVFSTYGQLAHDDTDTAKDVYRYDAGTGSLGRVSVGEAGYDANGNNSGFDATIAKSRVQGAAVYVQHGLNSRAISEDGSRIVFTTAEPLSPEAGNGLANAYEWHEGGVSLVSTGSASEPVKESVISSSGGDIFFITSQGLVPQDTDGEPDVYDARLGGGFPVAPAVVQPCSGDACQGPLTNPAPLLVPGSVSQAPGGNFAAVAPAPAAAPKRKAAPKCTNGSRLSHGKCVRSKRGKRAKKAKRATSDRRAGR